MEAMRLGFTASEVQAIMETTEREEFARVLLGEPSIFELIERSHREMIQVFGVHPAMLGKP